MEGNKGSMKGQDEYKETKSIDEWSAGMVAVGMSVENAPYVYPTCIDGVLRQVVEKPTSCRWWEGCRG